MKAIVQDAYGTVEALELRDIGRPEPRDDEVLLRVHAAGVDPSVWHLMTGLPYLARLGFGLRRPKSSVRGWDGAGRVEAVGAKVAEFKPGDEVFGTCDGSFAEYACPKADKLALKPTGLSFEEAAVLPSSGMTALQALRGTARPQAGRKVLVIGASGGVGTYTVQLAVSHGADVTGVCGPRSADHVRSLGVTDVVDYTREEITDRPHRYDVIVDTAGNRPLSLLRRALAPRGTLVIVGGEGGGRVLGGMGRNLRAVALSPFLRQNLRFILAFPRREDLLTLKELAENGTLVPVIDHAYPLEEAPEAIRHLEKGHPRGKLVITV
ncbi:NAD(P)-dependent alcohol dehydrogenase [Streptomyces sp. NBC_00443]|uniref:NAD(P)-dependent alcohol dehydrogenase n=1 Tax=Streptomyces sp. NBC_00443 TaxID=2975743 RepID=UPI002E2145D2